MAYEPLFAKPTTPTSAVKVSAPVASTGGYVSLFAGKTTAPTAPVAPPKPALLAPAPIDNQLTNAFGIKPQFSLSLPKKQVTAPTQPTAPAPAVPVPVKSTDISGGLPLDLGHASSTLTLPTKQQQEAVNKPLGAIDTYQQGKGAGPAALRAVTGTFKNVNDAMVTAAQKVDPTTGQQKTKTQRVVDNLRAGVSTLQLIPGWVGISAALQGASNIELTPPDQAPGMFEVPKMAIKYGAQGLNAAFGAVEEAKKNAVNAGFDKLLPQTPEFQQWRPLAQEVGSLVAVLAAGKIAHDVVKTGGEFKARTLATNDMVEAAAKILDLPTEKNVLGQARRIDPKTVTQSYREIAREVHPDNGGSPQELAVASQARAILEDYSTLSFKDFRAKYNEPLMGANKVIKQLPAGEAPQSSVTTSPEQGGYQSLFAEPKAVEVAPPVQAPTFEPPTKPFVAEPTSSKIILSDHPIHTQVMNELLSSEPGKRFAVQDGSSPTGLKFTGEKSTFPEWVPKELRSKKLIDAVTRHITDGTMPTKAAESRLYKVVADEMNASNEVLNDETFVKTQRQNVIDPFASKAENDAALIKFDQEYAKLKEQSRSSEAGAGTVQQVGEPVQAKAESQPTATQTAVASKSSKVGKSIEAKAIEKGLASSFSESAQYDPITIKDQANRVSELMRTDMERAKRIVTGKEKLPDGMLGGSIIKAMEDHAMATGDAQLALEIANSPLTSATSIHAQEMRMLAERNPDSAVVALQRLKKIKEEAVIKKGAPKKERLVEQIQERIKKEKPKATKETWSSFIESVTC